MGCLVFVIISGAGKYFFSSCHNWWVLKETQPKETHIETKSNSTYAQYVTLEIKIRW
jgi:hypothetical protein